MKSLTLALILALHLTGLWTHVSSTTRARLIAAGSGISSPPKTAPAPIPAPFVAPPVRMSDATIDVPAPSAMAIDADTGTVLYAKNIAQKRPIASVTKLATALVILGRHSPDETFIVPALPSYPPEAETIGLVPGDSFRLGNVLEAMLVPSANDAADALAIADSGSVAKFAAKMNAKMTEWGIGDTHFASASGLQDEGNYTTASSLAKIAALAIKNPILAGIVTHTSGTMTSSSGRVYSFNTTNELLATGQFYGIKTGYTPAAGECFVGLTRINGHAVITVILGASDRFGATTTLTNWIGHTWQWL